MKKKVKNEIQKKSGTKENIIKQKKEQYRKQTIRNTTGRTTKK